MRAYRGLAYKERREASSRWAKRIFLTLLILILYLLFSSKVIVSLEQFSGGMTEAVPRGSRVLYSPFLRDSESFRPLNKLRVLKRGHLVVVRPPYYRPNGGAALFEPFLRFSTIGRRRADSLARPFWEKKLVIKRLVALPGDRIRIDGGLVYIWDGMRQTYQLEQSPTGFSPYKPSLSLQPEGWDESLPLGRFKEDYTLQKGEYLALEDRRIVGMNLLAQGLIQGEQIQGRIFFQYWPLGSLSWR